MKKKSNKNKSKSLELSRNLTEKKTVILGKVFFTLTKKPTKVETKS